MRALQLGMAGWIAGSLALSTPSLAATGLSWQWSEGETHQFFIDADLLLPYVMVFQAELNSQVRVSELRLMLVTSCSHDRDIGKKAFELRCTFDDVRLTGVRMNTDRADLVTILDEIDAAYLSSHAQVVMTRVGHVRSVSLEGVPDSLRRHRLREENMRLLLKQAFASLDLDLPKKGDDAGAPWNETASLTMGIPSMGGYFGDTSVNHAIVETEGSKSVIESQGRGAVAMGEAAVTTPEGARVERTMDNWDLVHTGVATFDSQVGVLSERVYRVEGNVTASSQMAEGGGITSYVQTVKMRLVDGKQVPPLPPNGEVDRQRD